MEHIWVRINRKILTMRWVHRSDVMCSDAPFNGQKWGAVFYESVPFEMGWRMFLQFTYSFTTYSLQLQHTILTKQKQVMNCSPSRTTRCSVMVHSEIININHHFNAINSTLKSSIKHRLFIYLFCECFYQFLILFVKNQSKFNNWILVWIGFYECLL